MRKTKKALASLAIAAMTFTMTSFNAFATGTVPNRLAGTTAAQTAVAIAEQTGWTGTAILASSASYGMVDALTAGPLASSLKAPILLTGAGNSLDADTKAELSKLNVKTVYVTSGTAVISQAVLDEISAMGITVVPLGGVDKYETSVNIAKKMTGVTKVAVANGLQDALSIAAVASAANEPILLTDKDAVPDSVSAYLVDNSGITASDVIGGTGVISEAVKAEFPSATRHAGNTAYDTNNQVIQDFSDYLTYGNVYVANGVIGIDALAGAPFAALTKSPIVLTDGTVPVAATFVHGKLSADSVVTALGGATVVPDAVRTGVVTGVVKPVQGELSITSVSAINNTIQVTFSGDGLVFENLFEITQTGITGGGVNVQITNMHYNSTDKVMTLTVPKVIATTVDQSVVYKVSYNGGATVAAPAVIVPASTALITVTSVSPISVYALIGTVPELPTTVKATMSDGTTQSVEVTWENIEPSQYSTAQNFTLKGTIANSSVTAIANVMVWKGGYGGY